MGLFTRILEKLGMHHAAANPSAGATTQGPVPTTSPGTPKPGITGTATTPPMTAPAVAPVAKPAAMSEVDVVAELEKRAAANSQKLNWRTSIVDLLKLLDIDSGLADRKALATELGCPAGLMEDSAKMNTWLHQQVLARIAQNGGNIPKELLD